MIRRGADGSILRTLIDGSEGAPAEVRQGPPWEGYAAPKCSACEQAAWMDRDEIIGAAEVRFTTIDGVQHVHRYGRGNV